ncbi:ubiquitin carboxyl-terminal hydrolase 29 [Ochotona princeps]|uniref:ubiquitin carboxyl-terminal hydrolase 29 n=1 Tax=Ochotona princeps TaxID=9978 RepID=UPI00271524CD|nr:ubiquitin carboxyl-terminal hydrolase 29 [Ochotona princeps]
MEGQNADTDTDMTLWDDLCSILMCENFNLEEGREIPLPQQESSSVPKSPQLAKQGSPQNTNRKRQRALSNLEMGQDFLKGNNTVPNKKVKQCSPRAAEEDAHSKLAPPPGTTSDGNSNQDETVVSAWSFSDKSSVLPSEAELSHDDGNHTRDCDSEQVLKGFPNLGNTCYMNSILQSLLAIPSFVHDILQQGIPWENIPRGQLLMSFFKLLSLKDSCTVEMKADILAGMKGVISAVAGTFSGNQQNDAHEFLGQCLEQLKEDTAKLNSVWKAEREPGGGNSPAQLLSGSATTKVFYCPVVANFEFELQDHMLCQACGEVSVKTEPGNCVSVHMPPDRKQSSPQSLQNCLELVFQGEVREHTCAKCAHSTSMVTHTFGRLPRVLIIHLQRYCFSESYVLEKDDRQVQIPRYLSVASQCNESTQQPLPLARTAPGCGCQVLDLGEGKVSATGRPPTRSEGFSAGCGDSSDPRSELDRDVPHKPQRVCADGQERQQGDPGKVSELESDLRSCGDGHVRETELQEADPDAGLMAHHQEVPGYPQREDCEAKSAGAEVGVSCESETHKVPGGPAGMLNQLLQYAESPGTKHVPEVEETAAEAERLAADVSTGDRLWSYRLVSVTSHIGGSPYSGHYISDAYDFRKQSWFTYSDQHVRETSETMVRKARLRSGYIFFYMYNEMFEELVRKAATTQPTSS